MDASPKRTSLRDRGLSPCVPVERDARRDTPQSRQGAPTRVGEAGCRHTDQRWRGCFCPFFKTRTKPDGPYGRLREVASSRWIPTMTLGRPSTRRLGPAAGALHASQPTSRRRRLLRGIRSLSLSPSLPLPSAPTLRPFPVLARTCYPNSRWYAGRGRRPGPALTDAFVRTTISAGCISGNLDRNGCVQIAPPHPPQKNTTPAPVFPRCSVCAPPASPHLPPPFAFAFVGRWNGSWVPAPHLKLK